MSPFFPTSFTLLAPAADLDFPREPPESPGFGLVTCRHIRIWTEQNAARVWLASVARGPSLGLARFRRDPAVFCVVALLFSAFFLRSCAVSPCAKDNRCLSHSYGSSEGSFVDMITSLKAQARLLPLFVTPCELTLFY